MKCHKDVNQLARQNVLLHYIGRQLKIEKLIIRIG